MKDRMRRIHNIHFVGIGGSGMGGIAEVLLNLGYHVQGSDLKPNARHAAAREAGRADQDRSRGGERRQGGRARGLDGGAAGQPRGRRSEVASSAHRAACGDVGRADALPLFRRGRRHARQDHDDQHGRVDPRRGRPRSDVRHRRSLEERRQQRAPGRRQISRGRGGRERRVVHAFAADDLDCHQRGQRSPRRPTTATSSD